MTTPKTTKGSKEVFEDLGNLTCHLLDFAAFIASIVFSGYVLSVLWGWFVMPMFFVAALNIPSAIGVMMVARYVTKQLSYAQYVECKNEEAQKWERWMRWVKPAAVLLMGFVLQTFM